MNAAFSRRTKTLLRVMVVFVAATVIFLFPSVLYANDTCHPILRAFGCCRTLPPPE